MMEEDGPCSSGRLIEKGQNYLPLPLTVHSLSITFFISVSVGVSCFGLV